MDRFEKMDSVVKGVERGDAKGVQDVLNTIQDRTDQNVYMQQFQMKLQDSKACTSAGLPACEFFDSNKDGSPERIKAHGVTIEKVTGADGSQQLRASSEQGPSLTDRAVDTAKGWMGKITEGAKLYTRDLPDAINRSHTSDSNTNRLINDKVRNAGG